MLPVSLKFVTLPKHLTINAGSVPNPADPNNPFNVNMEVYTGWVSCDFGDSDGELTQNEIVSFLPSAPNTIRSYNSIEDIVDLTVTATIARVDPKNGNALFAVDGANVKLEPQLIPGVGGTPNCLVLRTFVGAVYAWIHTLTYQVTLLTKTGDQANPLHLDPATTPNI